MAMIAAAPAIDFWLLIRSSAFFAVISCPKHSTPTKLNATRTQCSSGAASAATAMPPADRSSTPSLPTLRSSQVSALSSAPRARSRATKSAQLRMAAAGSVARAPTPARSGITVKTARRPTRGGRSKEQDGHPTARTPVRAAGAAMAAAALEASARTVASDESPRATSTICVPPARGMAVHVYSARPVRTSLPRGSFTATSARSGAITWHANSP
mmetsp:Transcript_9426/g.30980  ORF Transcript_9426/g.30980 Transcript_9426/m.30980 type:complete len:214 (-) Transcript_9426:429-1070(-)